MTKIRLKVTNHSKGCLSPGTALWIESLYNGVFAPAAQQSESATHTHTPTHFRFLPHRDHCRVLSGVSCAVQ